MLPEKQGYQSTTAQSESFHDKPVRCFRFTLFIVFIAFGFISTCFGSKPIRCFLESDIWYRFVFVFFGKRRQQLPGSRMFFCNSMKLELLLFVATIWGSLIVLVLYVIANPQVVLHGCNCPVLHPSKQLG